jgi:hypothetical protein
MRTGRWIADFEVDLLGWCGKEVVLGRKGGSYKFEKRQKELKKKKKKQEKLERRLNKDPDTREEPKPTVSLSDLVNDNGEAASSDSDDDSDD